MVSGDGTTIGLTFSFVNMSLARHIPRLFNQRTVRLLPSTIQRSRFSTTSTTNNSQKSFSFLPSNTLDTKPRTKGLTEIRGPYYAPVTKTYLDELLSDWGEYVDGVKFAGGSFSLMPDERLRGLIETAHKHGKNTLSLLI